jgi:tetratricopeptide (TPR) repeat protein
MYGLQEGIGTTANSKPGTRPSPPHQIKSPGFGGRSMRACCCATLLISLLAIGCQDKKKPQTEAPDVTKVGESYDYRTALQNYKVGINYLNNGELQEAIIYLEKAIQIDDSNYRYWHGLGLAYSINGQLNEAEEALNKSVEINDDFSESYNLLGSIYTDQQRFDEAVEAFKRVIKDKSYGQPEFAYFNLARVKRLQGHRDEAIAAYQLAVQMQPEFHRAYVALGEIFKEEKDWQKMLYYYKKAEPAYANDVNVLFNIGYALFRLKQYERAKSYLAQVSILFPPPAIDKPTQDMLDIIEKILRTRRN